MGTMVIDVVPWGSSNEDFTEEKPDFLQEENKDFLDFTKPPVLDEREAPVVNEREAPVVNEREAPVVGTERKGYSLGFTPIKLGEKRVEDTFEKYGKQAPVVLANLIVDEITGQEGSENLFTYKTLLNGTAPYFDLREDTKNLSPEERKMSPNDIVKEFTDAKSRNFMQALFIESPRLFAGVAGAKAGVEVGARVGTRILMSRPPSAGTAATAVGAPVLTGLAGLMLGEEAASLLRDFTVGPPAPYDPESRLNVIAASGVIDALQGWGGIKLLEKTGKAGKVNLGLDGVLMLQGLQDLRNSADLARSLRFVRGAEDIFGAVAKAAYENPYKTFLAEAAMGATATSAALASESLRTGDPVSRGIAQALAPMSLSAAISISPTRLLFTKASQVFSKEKAIADEIDRSIIRYETALEKNPETSMADFNLQLNDDGEYSLIKTPSLKQRTISLFKNFGERQKLRGAQVLMDDFAEYIRSLMESSPNVSPEKLDQLIKEGSDKLIEEFRSGSSKPLFLDPAFARIRHMLERQGVDFSEQALEVRKAGEKTFDAEMEASILGRLFETGILTNTREGYLFASILAQKNFEAGLSERIVQQAKKSLEAYNRLVEGGFDANEAAIALYNSVDPIIDATSRTASNLYKGFTNHQILFGQDTPTMIKAFDKYADDGILPRDPDVRDVLPLPIKKALQIIENASLDHNDFKAGLPPISAIVREDKKLIQTQKAFDELLAKTGSESTDRFNDFMSRFDLTSENAATDIRDFIARQYGGKSGSRGANAMRTKKLLEMQADILVEEQAAIKRAEEYVKNNTVPPAGIGTEKLKEFRSMLLDFARRPSTEGADVVKAYALADIFERQLIDEKALRDIAPEDAEKLLATRAAANAYYNARQNIFNDGIFKLISKRTAEGSPQAVEILREKMKTLGTPTAAYIDDLQRAVRFSEDPINTPSLRPGALAQKEDIDLKPYSEYIEGALIPPSSSAAENVILNEVERLIVANKQIEGTKRPVIDPTDLEGSALESKDLGSTSAEIKAITTVLNNSKNNGLDMLPNLKSRLESIVKEGTKFLSIKESVEQDRIKYEAENLWYAIARGGQFADFTQTLKDAFGVKVRKMHGIKPAFDSLMEPIRRMNASARENPRDFLLNLQKENLFSPLKDVNISSLSDLQVKNLVDQAEETAKAGLKGLIIDYAKTVSGKDTKDGINYTQLRDVLFKENPKAYGMPSFSNWMRQQGLMTVEEVQNLRNSLDQFVSLEAEIAKNYPDLLQGKSPVKKAFVSILGSAIGGATHRMFERFTGGLLGGSGTLVASQAGAEASRNVLINARAAAAQDGLIALMQDKPQEIARFLRLAQKAANNKIPFTEGDTRNFFNLLQQMQAISIPRTAAIRTADEEPFRERRPYEPSDEVRQRIDPYGEKTKAPPLPPKRTVEQNKYLRLAPGGMGARGAQPNATPDYGAPVAPGGMGAPRASNQTSPTSLADRARLAAAFPNDPILKLMG